MEFRRKNHTNTSFILFYFITKTSREENILVKKINKKIFIEEKKQ
jgi:hypothetical protein